MKWTWELEMSLHRARLDAEFEAALSRGDHRKNDSANPSDGLPGDQSPQEER
jgi:hypothetical protein